MKLLYRDNKLVLWRDSSPSSTLLTHPPFCPIKCLTPTALSQLPAATVQRGVDVGVVVLLESRDGEVLLTRRAKHMRTFPDIWVPPGGHIEQGETLLEAGLRELQVSDVDLRSVILTGWSRRRQAWRCPPCWSLAGSSVCGRVCSPTY